MSVTRVKLLATLLVFLAAAQLCHAQDQETVVGFVFKTEAGAYALEDDYVGLVELRGESLEPFVHVVVIASGELMEIDGQLVMYVWEVQDLSDESLS